jgi:hypothetical protein
MSARNLWMLTWDFLRGCWIQNAELWMPEIRYAKRFPRAIDGDNRQVSTYFQLGAVRFVLGRKRFKKIKSPTQAKRRLKWGTRNRIGYRYAASQGR